MCGPFFHQSWETVSGNLPDRWTTYGTDKTPDGEASNWFEYGDGWKVLSDPAYPAPFAASYSSTIDGGKVDTWLISPTFTVPEAGGFIEFPMWTLSEAGSPACKMTLRISTGGAGKDSFESTPLLTKRISADGVSENYIVSLSEYAGKDVNLAFVNEGTQAGILCIGDITGDVFSTACEM